MSKGGKALNDLNDLLAELDVLDRPTSVRKNASMQMKMSSKDRKGDFGK